MKTNPAMRVVLFFAREPSEELTTQDVADKFGIDSKHVARVLQRRKDMGYLSSRAIAGQQCGRMWMAGPVIHAECGTSRSLEPA